MIIEARLDNEAEVWIATSPDLPGLVVEAGSWRALIEEVRLVLPELLALSGRADANPPLAFRVAGPAAEI